MLKSISPKTSKENILQAAKDGFFINKKHCKKYIKNINPDFLDNENFIEDFIYYIEENLDKYYSAKYNGSLQDDLYYFEIVSFLSPYYSKMHLSDKDIVLHKLQYSACIYKYIDYSLKLDPMVYDLALKYLTNDLSLSDFPDELRDDIYFMRCIAHHPYYETEALKFASPRLQDDEKFVLMATKEYPLTIKYASDRLRDKKDVMMKVCKIYGKALKFASERLKDNDDLVLEAVLNEPKALLFTTERLRNNYSLIILAIKENPDAYRYMGTKCKNDLDFCWDLLKLNGCVFQFMNEQLHNDYTFAYEAVKQDAGNLMYVSNRLKDDIHLAQLACKQDPNYIAFASQRIQNNPFLLK